ncbi:hypothetical protein AAFC00_000261 [Neodothiora populina]|uniref:Urease accessory protein UreF n=1 Tax=Neodothiora populina TaxID=2781224 RepID=A0ABR3PCA2_9PEZI
MDNPAFHALLLLSDSALPLGSFAFSSGLESYLAHHGLNQTATRAASALTAPPAQSLDTFIDLSLRNLASTSLPYVLDAFHHPDHLPHLDNDMDASTPCTVARRASIAQGKALVQLWERALAQSAMTSSPGLPALSTFITGLKYGRRDADGLFAQNAHFAPLFGVVCAALALSAQETSYLFLLNHAKAILSAAVRASVMGPYQSHAMLASESLQAKIKTCMRREDGKSVDYAGLTVPPMDLWIGRHELLYSRIFNS